MVKYLAVLAVVGLAVPALANPGDILVGDPFISSYNGWADQSEPPQTASLSASNWGIQVRDGALTENSDGYALAQQPLTTTTGPIKPYLLVNDRGDYTVPSSYTLAAQFASYDDDGVGLVFGFQDNQNYWRIGLRRQSNNPAGMGQGLWVANVKNGVETRYGPSTYTYPMSTNPTAPTTFDISVNVDTAAQTYQVYANGNLITSGTATADNPLTSGKVGLMSWYQRAGSSAAPLGTVVKSFSVTNSTGGPVFQDTFATVSQAALPVKLRSMNSYTVGAIDSPTDYGNFRLDFRRRGLVDESNGFNYATTAAPNVNFTGPSVAVDEPGSANFSDYRMSTRLTASDNDGIGVLVRVQDDDSYYRIMFCNQAMGTSEQRPPAGLSVQKADNGSWTELFRDSQDAPLFKYTPGEAFDVEVTAIGDTLAVKVTNPGTGEVFVYPLITDGSGTPLLTGTVGFVNWGNGDNVLQPNIWSAFGGVPGTSLVVAVPEPVTMGLFGVFGAAMMLRRRRNARV